MQNNHSVEKEIKVMISKRQYENLVNHFSGIEREFYQTNYYYYNSKISNKITIQ